MALEMGHGAGRGPPRPDSGGDGMVKTRRCPVCGDKVDLTVAGYTVHKRADVPAVRCPASGLRPHELKRYLTELHAPIPFPAQKG